MSKEKRTIVRGKLNGRKFTPQMTIDDWDQTGDLPEIRLEELEESARIAWELRNETDFPIT